MSLVHDCLSSEFGKRVDGSSLFYYWTVNERFQKCQPDFDIRPEDKRPQEEAQDSEDEADGESIDWLYVFELDIDYKIWYRLLENLLVLDQKCKIYKLIN